MAKKKFLDDVKKDPGRFYRNASDVNRDRRLNDTERVEILEAWKRQLEEDAFPEGRDPSYDPSAVLPVVNAALDDVRKRLTPV